MIVVAVPMYGSWVDGRYVATAYVNGTEAHSITYVALPATIEFAYNGVRYVVRVKQPLVPDLDETLIVEDLTPMDTVLVIIRSGERT